MSSEGDQISPNQLKTDSRSNEDTPTSNDSNYLKTHSSFISI